MELPKDSFKSKLKFFFSASFPKFFKFWKRDKYEQKNHIRLAVVGTRSSGKSFLLKDLRDAVGVLGGTTDNLQIDDVLYKSFCNYSPNESGGDEGTPIYACRRENIYGAKVKLRETYFSMEFVNIPGEIFREDEIKKYNELRNLLIGNRRGLFKTLTYDNGSETRLIVLPNCDIPDDSSTNAGRQQKLFSNWNTIFDELEKQDYKYVEGSQRIISGKKLMKRFFKYDTDSVMQSIKILLKNGKLISNTSFDIADYEANKQDLQFVFFQYCSLATDLVLCDRVFVPKTEDNNGDRKTEDNTNEEMHASKLAQEIEAFFSNIDSEKRLNFYLAFRNVDFLLRAKENNYQELLKNFNQIGLEKTRNIIYSLFHYLMMYLVYGYKLDQAAFDYRIIYEPGFDCKMLHKDDQDDAKNADELIDLYLDKEPNDGTVYLLSDLPRHIDNRVGNPGSAFRKLLLRTGWKDDVNTKTELVPHVYFTCTPVTQAMEVFRTAKKKGEKETEFYHEYSSSETENHSSETEKFSNGYSSWFGSSQLLMDILIQHDIYTEFDDTPLLRDLFKNVKEDD